MSDCKGFMWIGQSFACCDRCGEPFWEHTHDARIIRGRRYIGIDINPEYLNLSLQTRLLNAPLDFENPA